MKITVTNYTPIQLKLPVDYEKIINITDPVYSFMEVMNHIDLNRYIVDKEYNTGRPGYDSEKLLKITLFAFMENGYISLREIEKLCKTDIRFMWILDDMNVPSYVSIGNFINNSLKCSIEEIFAEINEYIFSVDEVDLNHIYNDQLLPAYNFQLGICDGYIAVFKAFQFASDMDCFQPVMQAFHDIYGFWPEYSVADAGYGSYNNYLFCEQHGMKKYMKFAMFNKETKDLKYHLNPYRSVNFKTDENGNMICPAGKRFFFQRQSPVKDNKYGRTEEFYQCENCEGCELRSQCHKGKGNRVIRVNEELTGFHKEVIDNLNSIHGALLRMNRSIQSEGAFGTIKWNRDYKRLREEEDLTVLCSNLALFAVVLIFISFIFVE